MKKTAVKKVKTSLKAIVSIAACFLIYACAKQELANHEETDALLKKTSNLYSVTRKGESSSNVDSISKFLSDLHFTNYFNVKRVSASKISFKVNQEKNSFYINTKKIDINTPTYFIEVLKNHNVSISSDADDFSVDLDLRNSSLVIKAGGNSIKYDDLTEDHIQNIPNVIKLPIYVAMLHDFLDITKNKAASRIVSKDNTNNTNFEEINAYEGSGVGFHKSRTNAEYFCNKDYQRILKEHPNWCSPGVSVSCVWDNHLCVCSAEFYSGSDCK